MSSKMLEKLQYENDKLKIYAPDSLNYITKEILKITLKKLPEIYDLFGIQEYRKFQINLFDDLQKFRNFVLSMRDDKNSLPEYAKGTYDRGMVNAYVPSNILINSSIYYEKLYNPSHEITHILYWELILKDNFAKRVVWLDEGLAQYISGQKEYLKNDNNFKKFYLNIIQNTKKYPNLNLINHRNAFVNENYNGYDLSYLCVKYLFETESKEEIRKIIYSYEKSLKLGKTILEDALNYFKNKYKL